LSSGEEDGGGGGTPSCPLSGDGDDGHGGGGSSPDDGAEVVSVGPVLLSTTKLTDHRLGGSGGGETPSSLSAVIGVAPLQQCGGVVWAEAAGRDALAPLSPPLSLFLCSPLHSLPRLLHNRSGMMRWGGGGVHHNLWYRWCKKTRKFNGAAPKKK
jgi:hypothetical protein